MITYESIYDRVRTSTFVSGSIADGYSGKRTAVEFSLIGDTVYTLHPTGCFKTPYPGVFGVKFTSEQEALTALSQCAYVQGLSSIGETK